MKNSVLAEARKKAGYTQGQLADKTGISLPTYQRYELGIRQPQIGTALRISQLLHEPVGRLFAHLVRTKDTTRQASKKRTPKGKKQ